MSDSVSDEDHLALPETSEGWRERLALISARDLLRLLQTEKTFPKSLFTGFRPGLDTVRHPIVTERLVKLLLKQPALAKMVAELALHEPKMAPEKPTPMPAPVALPPSDDAKLKVKLKALRVRVQQQEKQREEQAAVLAQALSERDAALVATAASQHRYQELLQSVDRERRQRERAAKPPVAKPPKPAPPPPTPSSLPMTSALEDALGRLLRRGKHVMVAGLCRELLVEEGLDALLRATIYGIYATALVGLAHEPEAADQERLATEAFLDAGSHERASEAFGRSLTHRPEGPLRLPERETLQRLLGLVVRAGVIESALLPLRRLRITAPSGFNPFFEAVTKGGKKYADALEFLSAMPSHRALSPVEPVALPVAARATATVTAQSLVEAVDAGDEELIYTARRGMVALHQSNPALAEALLESIAQLSPFAVFPFVRQRLRPIVVDASNVARYIADPLAQLVQGKCMSRLSPLLALREYLLQRGFFPVLLIADASLRHHIDDKARYVQLIECHVIRETPAGTEADEVLLTEARVRNAPLITRDRFKDWGEAAREIERLTFEIYPGGVALIAD